jgi:putative endonuclease
MSGTWGSRVYNTGMANVSLRATGDQGEAIACEYLETHGYVIVDRNWACRYGEIDIIARQGSCLVFIEVKTTRAADLTSALAQVTPRKRERILWAVHEYLDALPAADSLDWRIDAIAVRLRAGGPTIAHVEDAFDW